MSSIKLVSVNIERSKHLDRVLPFVEQEKPDVLCVQELMQKDISLFEKTLGAPCAIFLPATRMKEEWPNEVFGCGIFAADVRSAGAQYYVGSDAALPESSVTDMRTFNQENRAIVWCDLMREGTMFTIATTHFTWTPNGAPDDAQRRDMAALLTELQKLGEFVLSGDFNAPRGGEIFTTLAERYKDNIPASEVWSLDLSLHRAGEKLADSARALGMEGLMVDGLFSTPTYSCSDVRFVSGISDHRAIIATISRS